MNIYQFRNFLTLIFLINIFSGLSQSKLNSNNPNLQFRNSAHYFIENKGQWDEQVLFKSSFKGGNLWVQKSKLFEFDLIATIVATKKHTNRHIVLLQSHSLVQW